MTNSRYASTDAEEKIPVSTETSYYVVDCPNLHVVSGMQFGAEWSCNQDPGLLVLGPASCPVCRGPVSKSRQVQLLGGHGVGDSASSWSASTSAYSPSSAGGGSGSIVGGHTTTSSLASSFSAAASEPRQQLRHWASSGVLTTRHAQQHHHQRQTNHQHPPDRNPYAPPPLSAVGGRFGASPGPSRSSTLLSGTPTSSIHGGAVWGEGAVAAAAARPRSVPPPAAAAPTPTSLYIDDDPIPLVPSDWPPSPALPEAVVGPHATALPPSPSSPSLFRFPWPSSSCSSSAGPSSSRPSSGGWSGVWSGITGHAHHHHHHMPSPWRRGGDRERDKAAAKKARSVSSHSSSGGGVGGSSSSSSAAATLPKFVCFALSATGRSLLAWKKEGPAVVRIEVDAYAGRALSLADSLPPGGAEAEAEPSVKFAAEGASGDWVAVVAARRAQLFVVMLHASGLAQHSSAHPLAGSGADARCLATSADGTLVCVGLGARVVLLKYREHRLQWTATHDVPGMSSSSAPAAVKFQTCSFAADGASVVVSTQRRGGDKGAAAHSGSDAAAADDDDAVLTWVWQCRPGAQAPVSFWACQMPTDHVGLTTAQVLPDLSLAFVGGMTASAYPPFLAPSDRPMPAQPSSPSRRLLADYRIRCSCLCLVPASEPFAFHAAAAASRLVYFLDASDRVYRADLRARAPAAELVADVHLARGALRVSEEPAAIAAAWSPQEARVVVRIFWRQAGALWCLDVPDENSGGSSSSSRSSLVGAGGGRDGAPAMEGVKRNLRGAWFEAIGT